MTKTKIFCKRFLTGLKEELSLNDNFFVCVLCCCGIILTSIVLSFFMEVFYYVSAVLAVSSFFFVNYISKKNYYSFYILAFLFPFSMVMTIPKIGLGVYPILAALQGLILIMDIFFKCQKKELKINFWVIIASIVFCLYVLILWILEWYGITSLISLGVGMVLLVSLYFLRNELSFKKIGLCIILGLLIACFLGVFYKHYPTLSDYFDVTHALNQYRFSGLYKNTNGLTFFTLFAVSILMTMYLKRDITIIFYPLLVAMTCILFATVSKMALVVLSVEVIILILSRLILNRRVKGGWESVLCIILCISIAIGIQYKNFKTILDRVVEPFEQSTIVPPSVDTNEEQDEVPIIPEQSPESDSSSAMNDFTTGRIELSKKYLREVFESVEHILFGIDIGRNYNIGDNFSGEGSHNTYVDIVYHLGIVGFVILSFLLLMIFISIAKKKFDIRGVFVLIATGICFLCASSFSYVGFLYLGIGWLGCTNQSKKVDELNDSEDN